MQKKFVTDLKATDVLFGRGSGPNDHEGNVRFRQFVAERKNAYMATNHRMTKTTIAREIVDLVTATNGRFLRKVEAKDLQNLGLPEGTDCYEVVDDETIMEKAKQALRQNATKSSKEDLVRKSKPADIHKSTPPPQPPQKRDSVTAIYGHYNLEPIPLGSSDFVGSVVQQQQQQNHHCQPQQQPRSQDPIAVSYGSMGPPSNQDPNYRANVVPTGSRMVSAQPHQVLSSSHPESLQRNQQQHHQRQYEHEDTYVPPSLVEEEPVRHGRHNQTAVQGQMPPPATVPQEYNPPIGYTPTAGQVLPSRHRASMRASITVQDLEADTLGPAGSYNSSARMQQSLQQSNRATAPPMVGLMDSFSKMQTSDDDMNQKSKLYASQETMGTIEQLGSIADMSFGSSTFSVFGAKGTDDKHAFLDTASGSSHAISTPSYPSSASARSGGVHQTFAPKDGRESFESNASLTISDVAGPHADRRKSSSLSQSSAMLGIINDVRNQVDAEMLRGQGPVLPRTVAHIEENPDEFEGMGASSESLLKTFAEQSEDQQEQQEAQTAQQVPSNSDNTTNASYQQQQAEAYYRQDPNYKR